MIKPTVGRVVWFFDGLSSNGAGDPNGQPQAAIIAYVHNDRGVNLGVLSHQGQHFPMRNVRLVQPGDVSPLPTDEYCTWMPYQTGQAAKTEELQAQLEKVNGNG